MSFNISMKKLKQDNSATHLIRQKLDQLYTTEPNAKEERAEADASHHRSKHQQYMHELSQSGASLATIQTAWHNYYTGLPDNEKHEVWQEFYAEHNRQKGMPSAPTTPEVLPQATTVVGHGPERVDTIKKQVLSTIQSQARPRRKSNHVKSLMFGLSCGLITVVILLFGFFNERFIAPFVSPSKSVSNTAIIVDPNSTTVGPEPKIIIPKINVEIPVVYDEQSIDEHAMQSALERGVVHYAITSNPGEQGNGAIFGHSSNNILNKGKYKFAFVLLKRLEVGDTFMLQKDGKRYVYRVFDKKVVRPDNVAVLSDGGGKSATFSLITCDPPGTSLNRLVVTGEQITPSPSTNIASTAKKSDQKPTILPSNSETLWARFTRWINS